MLHQKICLLAAVFALPAGLLVSGEARADNLGRQGQIAIRSDLDLSITHSKQEEIQQIDEGVVVSVVRLVLGPSADYFVAPGLSLGGRLVYSYTKDGDKSTTGLGVGPRVGYFADFGRGVGLWPQFTYQLARTSPSRGTPKDTSSIQLSLPLVIEMVDHFFLATGPYYSQEVGSNRKNTDVIGISTQVGGYF
jgi:hypothetical protein